MRQPRCLTCPTIKFEPIEVTTKPPKLATAWDDDWEDEVTSRLPTTTPSSSSNRKQQPQKKEKTQKGPAPCLYHKVVFPPGSSDYALIECLGPGIPTSSIYKISPEPIQKPLQIVKFLQNNTRLREKISKIALPQIRSFPVMISGGYYAQVRLYLPPGLREDEITKYPMVLHM